MIWKIILENNDPNVRDFGYNNNTIRSQFSINPIGSNVHIPKQKQKWNVIDDTCLPKCKK